MLAGSHQIQLSRCAGCTTPYTPVPVATNFPHAKQEKLQAASHWQLIAEDTAKQLMRSLPDNRPLYISQPVTQSPFARVFSQQLISSLVTAGYPVYKHNSGGGVLAVEVDVQPIRSRQTACSTATWAVPPR